MKETLITHIKRGLKNPSIVIPTVMRKLKISEEGLVNNNGERAVVKDIEDPNNIKNFGMVLDLFKYKWIKEYIKGDVLDVGCGCGYGTDFLSKGVKSIIGIDLSEDAIKYCNKYHSSKAEFRVMSADSFSFNRKFDTIISFDMLEHITAEQQEEFAKKTVEHLKENGTLIVFAPNKLTQSEDYNEFHLKELTPIETKDLFLRHYKKVEMHGLFITKAGKIKREEKINDVRLIDFFCSKEQLDLSFSLYAICKEPRCSDNINKASLGGEE